MQFDLQCETHPKYQAKRRPRAHCEACKALYYLTRDGFRALADGGALEVVKPLTTPGR
jgi:hypothetical protein